MDATYEAEMKSIRESVEQRAKIWNDFDTKEQIKWNNLSFFGKLKVAFQKLKNK